VETLNNLFKSTHVSFQLPSLKVTGFSLDLLEKISVTRKSGLTFAVETPLEAWQMAINKEVTRDSVVAILEEAKKRGWGRAKFYFMIGLPVPVSEKSEEEEIVSFIADVGRRSRMRFNINVGIFVPKPHTPYQCAQQINSNTAQEKLDFIRFKLKPLGHKVSISDSLISRIEGLLSRGDEKAGLLCEEAWQAGSRLDAWDEYINKDIWLDILEKNSFLANLVFQGKILPLPWQVIDPCVNNSYLYKELEKSDNAIRTTPCTEKCNLCGACSKEIKVTKSQNGVKNTPESVFSLDGYDKKSYYIEKSENCVNHENLEVNDNSNKSDPDIYRVLFGFSKHESAVFYGHLSLIEIFSMSFRRASLPVLYTQGFNPLAKIEIASPLTTGISANFEIASADFSHTIKSDIFIENLNKSLPQGVHVEKAECFLIKCGSKKHSLSSLLWGFTYAGIENQADYVKATEEKVYRQNRIESGSTLFSLERTAILARNVTGGDTEWSSYFDTYRSLYPYS